MKGKGNDKFKENFKNDFYSQKFMNPLFDDLANEYQYLNLNKDYPEEKQLLSFELFSLVFLRNLPYIIKVSYSIYSRNFENLYIVSTKNIKKNKENL